MTAPLQTPTAPESTGLAVVAFVGAALMTVLGLRFAVYALRNKRANTLESRSAVWDNLVGVGAFGALYGALGVGTLVDARLGLARDAVLLGLLFVIGRTLRETDAASDGGERSVGVGGVGSVVVVLVALVAVGGTLVVVDAVAPVAAASVVEGVVGLGLLGYGLALGRGDGADRPGSTMLDTIGRHLLVVLLLAGFAVAVNVLALARVPPVLVESVRSVFVVMAATALMTATIKLRQSVATL